MNEQFLRLTNEVYKILEFFPESDPLKNRAKDKALSVMENPTAEGVDILLGYLWIAKTQGWLNSVNYLIITNEYKKIGFEKKPVSLAEPISSPKILPAELVLGGRQEKILDFLKENERAQVMDLQKVLPNITKRTIRRDLDELLKVNKITRIGEFNQVFYQLGHNRTKVS